MRSVALCLALCDLCLGVGLRLGSCILRRRRVDWSLETHVPRSCVVFASHTPTFPCRVHRQ